MGLLVLSVLFGLACASGGASTRYYCPEGRIGGESIWYLEGTIYTKSASEIKMSDGSTWQVTKMPYGLTAFSDAAILAANMTGSGLAYFRGGDTATVERVRGEPLWERGALTRVVSVDTDGMFLRTSDGRSWQVSDYDQATARYWWGSFPAAVHESHLMLLNLERIEEVGVYLLCPGVSEARIRALTERYP